MDYVRFRNQTMKKYFKEKSEDMNVREELKSRKLPDILLMNNGDTVTGEKWQERKKEMLEILSENLFGHTPGNPKKVESIEGKANRHKVFGGKTKTEIRSIVFDTPKGDYSFPIEITIPVAVEKPPVILYLSFGTKYPVPEEALSKVSRSRIGGMPFSMMMSPYA